MSEDVNYSNERLPVIALRNLVILPNASVPLFAGRARSVASVQSAIDHDQRILCVTQKDADVEEPTSEDLYPQASLAKIIRYTPLSDGSLRLVVSCQQMVYIHELELDGEGLSAYYQEIEDELEDSQHEELERTSNHLRKKCIQYLKFESKQPQDKAALERIKDPAQLVYAVLTYMHQLAIEDKFATLDETNLVTRIYRLLAHLDEEIQKLQMERKIDSRVKKQMERDSKNYYLNEKMKAIQRELGGREEAKGEQDELEDKIKEKGGDI